MTHVRCPVPIGDPVRDLSSWAEGEQLLEQLLELDPPARLALLEEVGRRQPDLRAALEAVLREEDESGFLPPGGAAQRPVFTDLGEQLERDEGSPPVIIGAYRVLDEIGRGGMARVFLAERVEGGFDQKVALKLVLPARLRSDRVRERFEQERRILAGLSHPAITQLLDGGSTPSGEPYFAMELVEGRPIEEYCDVCDLDLQQRVRLFLQVASAVGHAHRQLVVHRDLKSSNVLVTEAGQVKLLDFGIAKLLDDDALDATATQHRVLTPACASPEQLRGEPITVASDIYQLGHLLYRLVTGSSPYARSRTHPSLLQAAILEDPPTPPSRAAVDVGEATGGEGQPSTEVRWARELRGDLDAILLMALRKEPERRYATVQALVHDLESYLDGRPVTARPDSAGYRLHRFVGRNRAAVAVAAVAALGLGAAIVTFTVRLAAERDVAQQEAAKAQEVASFLQRVFSVADPSESRGRSVTVLEVLDEALGELERDTTTEPLIDVTLRRTLGSVHGNLGLLSSAEEILRAAAVRAEERLGPRHRETIVALNDLGTLLWRRAQYSEAESVLRDALSRSRSVLGESSERTLRIANDLGLVVWRQGRFDEAGEIFRDVLARRVEAFPSDDPATLDVRNNLAGVHYMKGDYPQSERSYREVWESGTAIRGEDHPFTLNSMNNLAMSLVGLGRRQEAIDLFERLVELRRRVLGAEHPGTLGGMAKLGESLLQVGEVERAEPVLREVLATRRRVLGEEHPDTLWSMSYVALAHQARGELDVAEALFGEVLARRRVLGETHPDTLSTLRYLAALRGDQGRTEEAEALLRQVLAAYVEEGGAESYWAIVTTSDLGLIVLDRARPEEARRLLSEALGLAEQHYPDDRRLVGSLSLRLGRAHAALADTDRAAQLVREAIARLEGGELAEAQRFQEELASP